MASSQEGTSNGGTPAAASAPIPDAARPPVDKMDSSLPSAQTPAVKQAQQQASSPALHEVQHRPPQQQTLPQQHTQQQQNQKQQQMQQTQRVQSHVPITGTVAAKPGGQRMQGQQQVPRAPAAPYMAASPQMHYPTSTTAYPYQQWPSNQPRPSMPYQGQQVATRPQQQYSQQQQIHYANQRGFSTMGAQPNVSNVKTTAQRVQATQQFSRTSSGISPAAQMPAYPGQAQQWMSSQPRVMHQQSSMQYQTQFQQQAAQRQQQLRQNPQYVHQQQYQQPLSQQVRPESLAQKSSGFMGTQPGVSGVKNVGKASEPSNRILGKRSIQEIVAQVDPHEKLDPEVEDVLLEIADDFVETVTTFACALAKHRKSSVLEAKDVLLHLERNWNMTIPGFGGDEYRSYKRPSVSELHRQRLASVRQSLASGSEGITKNASQNNPQYGS